VRRAVRLGVVALIVLALAEGVLDAGVLGSKHDISTPGAGYSDQVCAFCHTPHVANTVLGAPLWNRVVDRTKVFALYQSATLNTTPGDPNDSLASLLCLGCHDGTLATVVFGGNLVSDKHELVNAPGPGGIPDLTSQPNCERCHPELFGPVPPVDWLGTDLSNDHPISMTYPTAAEDPEFNLPPDLTDGWAGTPLFSGMVECASCHDVHDPNFVPFLRQSNAGSSLCLTCHQK
jgi:predicted CXXCH cytochrome family protein